MKVWIGWAGSRVSLCWWLALKESVELELPSPLNMAAYAWLQRQASSALAGRASAGAAKIFLLSSESKIEAGKIIFHVPVSGHSQGVRETNKTKQTLSGPSAYFFVSDQDLKAFCLFFETQSHLWSLVFPKSAVTSRRPHLLCTSVSNGYSHRLDVNWLWSNACVDDSMHSSEVPNIRYEHLVTKARLGIFFDLEISV